MIDWEGSITRRYPPEPLEFDRPQTDAEIARIEREGEAFALGRMDDQAESDRRWDADVRRAGWGREP